MELVYSLHEMITMKSRFTVLQIFKQSAPVLMSMVLISITTGSRLNDAFNFITIKNPVLLIALPAFVNVAGDLAGVFASRLTSMIYAGRLSSTFRPYSLYLLNLFTILSVCFTAFTLVGVVGNILAGVLFHNSSPWIPTMFVIIVAGETATLLMSLIATVIIRISYSKNLDPDSITPPVSTTGGDLVGTFTLLFLAEIFL